MTPFLTSKSSWRGTWFGTISAMFEVAWGPLGERGCVNPNKYSCYFIIVVMSYVVRNTGCWNQTGSKEGLCS